MILLERADLPMEIHLLLEMINPPLQKGITCLLYVLDSSRTCNCMVILPNPSPLHRCNSGTGQVLPQVTRPSERGRLAPLLPAPDPGEASRAQHGHHRPLRPQILVPKHPAAPLAFFEAAAPAPRTEGAGGSEPAGSPADPQQRAGSRLSRLSDDHLCLRLAAQRRPLPEGV